MNLKERLLKFQSPELDKILKEKEPGANRTNMQIFCVLTVVFIAAWLLFKVRFFVSWRILEDSVFIGGGCLLMASAFICHIRNGEGRWIKYMFMTVLILLVFGMNIMTGYKTWLLYALPIVMTCRYFSQKLTFVTSVMAAVAAVGNAFTNTYLSYRFNLMDLNMIEFPEKVTLTVQGFMFSAVTAPGVSVDFKEILKNSLKLMGIPNIIILFFVMIACGELVRYNQKLILEMNDMTRLQAALQLELIDKRQQIMMSQIQPHFLYNSLSAIQAIEGNSDETIDAIDDFGKYLRGNLEVVTKEGMVPFKKELDHVERFVNLEELRFGDRLDISYEINVKEFELPPLAVQILVENAISHGIEKRPEGGWVKIRTSETSREYRIDIIDNGVGFDTSIPIDEEKHTGIATTRLRLFDYCKGSLEIKSQPGEGTTATILIPKDSKK